MNNDPLMFIDSFKTNLENTGNQKDYDSRNKKKNLKKYRLEDIKAMLLYRINVLCEIRFDDDKIEGIVTKLDEETLTVRIDRSLKEIPISSIKEINILKL